MREKAQQKRPPSTEQAAPAASPPKPQASRILYYHCDHLGTPQELADSDGHLVWAAEYAAWGKVKKIERPHRSERHGVIGNTALKDQPQADAVADQAANQALYAEPVEQNLRNKRSCRSDVIYLRNHQ